MNLVGLAWIHAQRLTFLDCADKAQRDTAFGAPAPAKTNGWQSASDYMRSTIPDDHHLAV
jgi:hypothetical protein